MAGGGELAQDLRALGSERASQVDPNYMRRRFGDVIDFGPCLVGRNLNLLNLRGYGELDELAAISAPDVFDQKDNPTGTQRDLKLRHAMECLSYAIDSQGKPAEEDPRFFPEILLNARDTMVIELYDLEDENTLLDFDSFTDPSEVDSQIVGLRVRVGALEFPKPLKSPQISRVDGNHRLHGTDELLADAADTAAENGNEVTDDDFPVVSFSLLIGLDPTQEASLFRDINGEHEGMEVAHLDTLTIRTQSERMKGDPKFRPLWIANELAKPGRAFEDMVFMGGSKRGLKREGGVPPVRINSLKSTIHQMMRSAPTAETFLADTPEVLLELIDNFWKAVRSTFPEAWNDRKNYILLQAIGLGAFARFGGMVIDQAVKEKNVSQSDFERYLKPVADHVSLAREDYPGIAGAGGQKFVYELLIKASEPDAVTAAWVKDLLTQKATIDEKLGLKEDDEEIPPEG